MRPSLIGPLATIATMALATAAPAQVSRTTIDALGVPAKATTRIGVLEYKDGVPLPATVQKAYDYLDFTHALDVYLNTFQGVSTEALLEGFRAAGVQDNQILIFRDFMDAKSLFLTANADVVYYVGILDLTKGPMVIETPPGALGTLDDMWFNWVIDFGAPGPDRGAGGRFLILPPGYDGSVPDGGLFVAHSATTRVLILGRSFIENDDPRPTAAEIERTLKIYPYVPGTYGTSIADLLTGKVRPGRPAEIKPTVFVEGSGKAMNTIPPSDYGFYEMLDRLVQAEPVGAIDAERMGALAAIGIVKGKPFAPDERMRKILTEAAAAGAAMSRTLSYLPRESEGFAVYPGSSWSNSLWLGGYTMETPPPLVTKEGIKPFPPTGAKTLNARTGFFYYATGITPAMIMRLPDVGSQYLMAFVDANKQPFDGAKTYKVTLPPNIPAAKFWSFTLYDNQTRSMLDTPQRFPRAGSQGYPSPAAEKNADGSITVYFSPAQPNGVARGNWIQTIPGKGWNTILRLYSPMPSFFSKEWKPGEIELVK